MRNGFLASLGGLLTSVGIAFSQVPYGYYPPYPGTQPGYAYSQGYAVPGMTGRAPGYPTGWVGYPAPTGVAFQLVPTTTPNIVNDNRLPPSAAPVAGKPVANIRPDVVDLTPGNTSSSAPRIQIVPQPPLAAPPIPQPPPAAPAIPQTLPAAEMASAGHDEVVHPSSCTTVQGCASCGSMVRFWGSAEYLLWYVKDQPLPVPMLTTGSLSAAATVGGTPGALGVPGTTVISPSNFNMSTIPGGRLTAGMALDSDDRFGIEASGFLLATRSAKFFASSVNDGDSVLAFPVTYLTAGVPSVEGVAPLVSSPSSTGFEQDLSAYLLATTKLWGTEANGLANVYRNQWLNVDGLGGLRYLDLEESLTIGSLFSVPAAPGVVGTVDRFATRNQFYGGQLGLRGEAHHGRFFANMTGKVALGTMHEVVTINGAQSVNLIGTSYTVYPTGLYAQTTNIGRQTQDEFSVVPEVQVQVGVDLLRNVRLFGGYQFLYATNVVRPGDQIDRGFNSNLLFIPPTLPTGTVLVPANPAALMNRTDFWAHGVSIGLELRY